MEEEKKVKEDKKKKKKSGAYSKTKGSAYERQVVKELKEISGDQDLCTSRSDSKKLDDMKIDISDPNKSLPCYIQCKKTQATPQIKKINLEVGLKDKPLAIFWKKVNGSTNKEEFVCIPKDYFYKLINNV